LATLLAAKGKKTCLLDMDFQAPSLHSLFETAPPEYWLNDYLNGDCEPNEAIQNCNSKMLDGQLFVGFANPSTEAILKMSAMNARWEVKALQRLFELRKALLAEQGFEYLIFDTGPGLQYSSINSVVAADIALIVATPEGSDIVGTQQMVNFLHRRIGKRTMVLFNKVPSHWMQSEEMMRLKDSLASQKTIFCDDMECFCDLPASENPCYFAYEKEHHPFSKGLERIVSKLMLLNAIDKSRRKH